MSCKTAVKREYSLSSTELDLTYTPAVAKLDDLHYRYSLHGTGSQSRGLSENRKALSTRLASLWCPKLKTGNHADCTAIKVITYSRRPPSAKGPERERDDKAPQQLRQCSPVLTGCPSYHSPKTQYISMCHKLMMLMSGSEEMYILLQMII